MKHIYVFIYNNVSDLRLESISANFQSRTYIKNSNSDK